jgi:hypothetical protein
MESQFQRQLDQSNAATVTTQATAAGAADAEESSLHWPLSQEELEHFLGHPDFLHAAALISGLVIVVFSKKFPKILGFLSALAFGCWVGLVFQELQRDAQRQEDAIAMAEKIQNAQKRAGNNGGTNNSNSVSSGNANSGSGDQSGAQQASTPNEDASNPRYPDLMNVAENSSGGGVNSQILRIDPDLWWVPMVN